MTKGLLHSPNVSGDQDTKAGFHGFRPITLLRLATLHLDNVRGGNSHFIALYKWLIIYYTKITENYIRSRNFIVIHIKTNLILIQLKVRSKILKT